MELATLARPYAEAIFELATEANDLASWSELLCFFKVIISSPEIQEISGNRHADKTQLSQLLWDVCQEGYCRPQEASPEQEKQVKNFLSLLIHNDRFAVVPEIAKQYEALKAQQENYVTVDVTSTYAIKPPQKKELTTTLEKRYGKDVHINTIIDRSLMGGWLIRADDQVIDLSVKGRLKSLENEILG